MFEKTKIGSVTAEQAVKYADIIKAAYDGKRIQMKAMGGWCDMFSINFGVGYEDGIFRIKPEPEIVKIKKQLYAKVMPNAPLGFWVTIDGKLFDVEITMTEVV